MLALSVKHTQGHSGVEDFYANACQQEACNRVLLLFSASLFKRKGAGISHFVSNHGEEFSVFVGGRWSGHRCITDIKFVRRIDWWGVMGYCRNNHSSAKRSPARACTKANSLRLSPT